MITAKMDNCLMDFWGLNVYKTLPKVTLEIVHRNGSRCTSNIVNFPCRLFVKFCVINVQFISPIYPWKRCNFENILTKNFAHGRSKIVAQGRYGLGGGSIV